MAKERIIVGLMSGTSVDGIDAAVVQIVGTAPRLKAKVLHLTSAAWPAELRQRLLAVMAPAATTTQELCRLHAEVAEHFADAALQAIRAAGLTPEAISAIASHGQTVCHLPPGAAASAPTHRRKRQTKSSAASTGSTLQLGDPSVIAVRTGILTVGNFRPADMALGGQGAPLVPWADAALLAHRTQTRCVQNIGGIANVTYLPPLRQTVAKESAVLAFDTGPGNMLMDALVSLSTGGHQTFDADGAIARRGRVDTALLRWLQGHRYFQQTPPKSTGRELFGTALAEQLLAKAVGKTVQDLVATATCLTAWSIADAYRRFLPRMPDEVILCGGGADNPTLVAMLADQLAAVSTVEHVRITRIDDHGIPNKAKEAASFALLAAATLDGVPGNLPSVTGARRPVVLGCVALG